jgi:hypothetical protein
MVQLLSLLLSFAFASDITPLRPSDIGPMRKPYTQRQIRVAIADTGLDKRFLDPSVKICKNGHYDFVENRAGIKTEPSSPHGTYIANIIGAELGDADYCIVVYNVWDENGNVHDLIRMSISAYRMASVNGVSVMNYSLQGFAHSYIERNALVRVTSSGLKIFVAAGNDNIDLNQVCSSYPACYDIPGLVVVGAHSDSDPQARASYSNYGRKVDVWKSGSYNDIRRGVYTRGTSFAAPRAAADYVLYLLAQ